MTRWGRLRRLVLVAGIAAASLAHTPEPAAAATVECIPASKFSTLARITEGSVSQLADLLGLTGRTPPEDGCRAVLLSGPVDAGSAAALLAAIERNGGWLSQVYIAVSDGDLTEEVALATLMHDFALTGLLLESGDLYLPDMLTTPRRLPVSVSDSWPVTALSVQTPLALSFEDYLDDTDRVIAPAKVPCGAACWTILAGAVERRIETGMGKSAADPPNASQSPRDARLRDEVRRVFGASFGLTKAAVGYRPSEKLSPFPGFDRSGIEKDCRPGIDYANVLQGDIARASNGFAEKGFAYMQLAPMMSKVRRFQEASANAELCMRKGMTRLRMSVFEAQCKTSCTEKLQAVETGARALLARLVVQAEKARQTEKPRQTDKPQVEAPKPSASGPGLATIMKGAATKLQESRPR